jgi:hypothetical protein
MSKMPLFFVVVVAIIVIAASFRFVQQRRERPITMPRRYCKNVVVSNKREKTLNDRRSRQQQTAPAGTSVRYEASFKPKPAGWK